MWEKMAFAMRVVALLLPASYGAPDVHAESQPGA